MIDLECKRPDPPKAEESKKDVMEDLSYDDVAKVVEKIKDSGIDPMLQHERKEEP